MNSPLFAAAFLFDDTPAARGGGVTLERRVPDRAEFLARVCADDPALRFRLADRAAFLARVCRGDPDLQSRIEALLDAHLAADSFPESSSDLAAPTPVSQKFPRT